MVASSLPWTKYNLTDGGGYRWATFDDIDTESSNTKRFLQKYRPLTIDHKHCKSAVLFEGYRTDQPVVYATYDEGSAMASKAIPRYASWMGEGFEDWIFHDDAYALSVDFIHDMIETTAGYISKPVGYEETIGDDDKQVTHMLEVYVNQLLTNSTVHIDDRTWILVWNGFFEDSCGQEWREPISGSVIDDGILVPLFNEASLRGAASLEGLTEAQKELIRLSGHPLQLSWG